MEELLRNLLESLRGPPAYFSIFGILVACGLGVPIPEDISLIMGGFLVHKGAAQLPIMMTVGFAGILVGDSIIYLIGRLLGERVVKIRLFARIITAEKRARVEGLFAAQGQKIVMLARFLPGVRAVTYFTAGSARMSYLGFIAFDGLAALASAPLIIYLGYRFGGQLELLIAKIREGQIAVIGTIVAGVVAYLLYRRSRKNAQQRALAAAPVPAPAPAAQAPAPAASAPVRVSDATSG